MFHIAWHEYKIFLIAKRSYLFSIHVSVFGCHFVATFYDVWFLGILDENTNWKHHQWNTIFTFRAINFLLVPKFTTNFDHKIYVNYWNAKSNRMQKKTLSNCISIFAKLIARSKEWYYTNIRIVKTAEISVMSFAFHFCPGTFEVIQAMFWSNSDDVSIRSF